MTVKGVKKVPFESLVCDKEFNNRQDYEGIEELAVSIEEDGLLQPIGVTAKKHQGSGVQQYFIVYGFRRYLAMCAIRERVGNSAFDELNVMVVEGTLQDLQYANLKENIDRKALKPHEIVTSVRKMVNAGLEQRDIAARLGRPQSWVSYHYKVATKLGVVATKAFVAGDLTLEQSLNVADVPEEKQQEVVDNILAAGTRKEARKIAKDASKEEGKRRVYANKGRPTAKNLTKLVQDVSFDGTNPNANNDQDFFNGVAAGMRIALGDTELEGLDPKASYCDTDFGKTEAQSKPKKRKAAKKKSSSEPTDGPPPESGTSA